MYVAGACLGAVRSRRILHARRARQSCPSRAGNRLAIGIVQCNNDIATQHNASERERSGCRKAPVEAERVGNDAEFGAHLLGRGWQRRYRRPDQAGAGDARPGRCRLDECRAFRHRPAVPPAVAPRGALARAVGAAAELCRPGSADPARPGPEPATGGRDHAGGAGRSSDGRPPAAGRSPTRTPPGARTAARPDRGLAWLTRPAIAAATAPGCG